MNPAREVKTQKFSRTEGKTPAPPHQEVQRLLDSIDVTHLVGLRDRALLAVMAYTFARIGAVVALTPQDYFQVGKRSLIRFREKGGKEKEIPVHHKLEEYLDTYLKAAQLSKEPTSPLFRSTRGRSRELGADGLSRMFNRSKRAVILVLSGGLARRSRFVLSPLPRASRESTKYQEGA